MHKGLFITYEGGDGSGKSTQISLTYKTLKELGYNVLMTREPGGCDVANKIRNILLDSDNTGLLSKTELLLFAAARAQHVEEIIRPHLNKGFIVLCDRYTDSTVAYQSFGRGLDIELINQLNDIATDGLYPDITLVLDVSVENGLTRVKKRSQTNESRIDNEKISFHQKVNCALLSMTTDCNRYVKIDANKSIEEIQKNILDTIMPKINMIERG